MKKVLFFCLVLFPIVLSSKASEPSTHYIIAFDQVVPNYTNILNSPNILIRLDSMLEGIYNDETDYVSVVGYGLNGVAPSVEDYVIPYKANGKEILWYKMGGKKLSQLFTNWQGKDNSYRNFSMQTMVKPYAVMETMNSAHPSYTERTVFIMVTDAKVNGLDDNYQNEWKNVRETPSTNRHALDSLHDGIYETFERFNGTFYFKEMDSGKLSRNVVSYTYQEPYQIIPYEVVATNKPSIYSVTDMPSPLPLRRIRGGYEVKVNVSSIDDKYEIKKVFICNAKGDTFVEREDGELEFIVPSKNIKEGDTLNISMSLLFKDGMYNGTLMSPYNENYVSGMSVQQMVRMPEDAKVLGILPLSDGFWWWSPNDVVKAVMVWDLIILLVIIIVVGWVLYSCFVRINAYKPDDKSLKITKV